MDVNDSDIQQDLQAQAAYWFTRMHSGEESQRDKDAFQAWFDAAPAHRHAYERVGFAWDASLTLPEQAMRAILAKTEPPQARLMRRRTVGIVAAGLCASLLAFVLHTPSLLQGPAQYTLTVNTEQGQRARYALPDGTILYANTATNATVTFYKKDRIVNLSHGEIFLDVAHDAARPFIVDTQLGDITVTGTRFNVRNDVTDVEVAVVTGSVNVHTLPGKDEATATLTKGLKISINKQSVLSEAVQVDTNNITAWQRGRIVVENMPLAQVVKELNRYLPMPALLNAPRLSQFSVTGTFDANQPDSMINALPMIAPVSLYQLTDGRYRIVER